MQQVPLFESPKQKAVRNLIPDLQVRPTLWLSQVEAYLQVTGALGDGVSKQRLIKLIESGELAGVKVGNQWLVDRESLREYLARIQQQLASALGIAA